MPADNDNTIDLSVMVTCEDGVERLESECRRDMNGLWQPADECVCTVHGDWVHRECDDLVHRADGEWDWYDNCTEIDGEWYSDDECYTCECCSERVLVDDTHLINGGNTQVCQHCLENHTNRCDECDEVRYDDDVWYDDNTDTYRCDRCRDRRPPLIESYSSKAANQLRPASKDPVLFGIELEVEGVNGDSYAAAEFTRKFLPRDYCVFKTDGSLGAGGFEIVTRPDSVAFHKPHWQALFDNQPTKRMTSWTNGRCGMHIHVTRRPLSELQIGKLLCFLNDPLNERFVVRVAGRRSDRWGRIEKKKVTDAKRTHERYVALNLTNSKTIEFRIFKGTLAAPTFFKNLEFVAALVEYTAPCGRSIAEATSWHHFVRWVSYKTYPHLYDWLVRRGYVVDRRPKRKAG